jgi:hypothetical protein
MQGANAMTNQLVLKTIELDAMTHVTGGRSVAPASQPSQLREWGSWLRDQTSEVIRRLDGGIQGQERTSSGGAYQYRWGNTPQLPPLPALPAMRPE